MKGKDIEEDNKFTYLGSVVTDKGGTDEDVKNRNAKARNAFNILKTVWNTLSFKIRLFNTNVKSVLLYGHGEQPRQQPECYKYSLTNV